MAVTGKRAGQRLVSILPQLSVRGGLAAMDFYRAAFGAEVVYQVGGTADNQSVVAEMSIEGASFWVADESPAHGNFSPESVGGSTTRMLLIVDDPQAAIDRAVAAGATLVYPAAKEHGWLLGRIHDPFGHHWEIGKPLGAWPPDRAGHGTDVRVRAGSARPS
jgi:PhnB protein